MPKKLHKKLCGHKKDTKVTGPKCHAKIDTLSILFQGTGPPNELRFFFFNIISLSKFILLNY